MYLPVIRLSHLYERDGDEFLRWAWVTVEVISHSGDKRRNSELIN